LARRCEFFKRPSAWAALGPRRPPKPSTLTTFDSRSDAPLSHGALGQSLAQALRRWHAPQRRLPSRLIAASEADRGTPYQNRIQPISKRGGGWPCRSCFSRLPMAFRLSRHGHSSPPWKWPIARIAPNIHYEKPVLQRPYLWR
jgi:hypothetical protein